MINAWRVFFEKQVYQEVLAKLMKSDPLMMAAATTTTAESPYVVREGKAEIHFKSKSDAFYNPVQEFNRDMSIAAIRQFLKRYNAEERRADKITLLEALSASGLRSIRYAKEIPGLADVVANDFSRKAVESIERNVSVNGVADTVRASHADAAALMYSCRKAEDRFTIVDLDPYGSAAPFLDAAVQGPH